MVLQTAITPRNASNNIEFSWSREAQPKDPSPGYIAIMQFSELQVVPNNALREFYVYLNGELWYPVGITPFYLSANFAYDMDPLPDSAQYNVSINATANSTLPPFINAVEIFSVISTGNVGTDSKDGSTTNTVKPENETPTNHVPQGDVHTQSSLQLENRLFTYSEIEVITDKFKRVLGQGGFGKVYSGSLADGTQLAVKVRSQTSNQGVKEFLAEAQILTRIHHKNLVSMIGYCKDGHHMALVYEYYATRNPTTKSDVYSFGVVLLELVAGEPAIVRDPEPTNIIDWARRRLARGNIEGVVDARMRGDHDVNSVWKVAELALRCTVQPSSQRPAMADVVAQLQECLHLEAARSGSGHAATGSFYTGTSRDPNSGYSAYSGESIVDDERHSSSIAFEMERVGREPRMDTGPSAR
nr:unnamed protein product [Digitaria exilis]